MNELEIQSAVLHTSIDEDMENQIEITLLYGERIFVPVNPANRHYAEIMRQVEAGTLTIAEAPTED